MKKLSVKAHHLLLKTKISKFNYLENIQRYKSFSDKNVLNCSFTVI